MSATSKAVLKRALCKLNGCQPPIARYAFEWVNRIDENGAVVLSFEDAAQVECKTCGGRTKNYMHTNAYQDWSAIHGIDVDT